ncbi:mitochondrial import inner membrane translocase subunit Tim17-B-like [Aphidius gifuensis]|uniref:mitochondrial import inner membrane translocase subunit Tim17-B-like n=1 Tax=Aphidius gifuensis TaxID=684658 RepID=UPI001CDC510F|nr:mitochondrial import inner membrane translocase subunit Tim17-B-like [Aphidius gifuensis]XP_044008607.1 mitochondrial import inner membrane translocase subunit Tim17-B-like [Aphidius gifuensis]
MAQDLYTRNPCPLRIVEDTGGAFALGLIGGGLFQGIQGFRNAPSGLNKRFIGSITAIKTRSPMLAGSFAMWGATFASVECTLIHYRQKEDPWNTIMSGTITGAILATRSGVGAMAASAVFGGVLLSLMEVIGVFTTRKNAEVFKQQPLDFGQPPEGYQLPEGYQPPEGYHQ